MYRRIELKIDPRTAGSHGLDYLILHEALFLSGLPGQNRNWQYLPRTSARFFFTEEGWNNFGHKALGVIRKKGRLAKVLAVKEKDHRLQVIYRDRWQVNVRFGGRRTRKS